MQTTLVKQPVIPVCETYASYLGDTAGELKSKDEFLRDFLVCTPIVNLLTRLKLEFKNPQLLLTSFTHSSFSHEFLYFPLSDNEKLEFLGDAIWGSIISEMLYLQFPDLNEGHLSKLKGSVVNEQSLYQLARQLNLQECLLIGKGEIKNQGHLRPSVLSDAFEALVGAIFLDQGYEYCQQVVEQIITLSEKNLQVKFLSLKKLDHADAKSRLQEETMQLYKVLPEYRAVVKEDGLQKFYEVSLWIKNKFICSEIGPSKKVAEKKLAHKTLTEESYKRILC